MNGRSHASSGRVKRRSRCSGTPATGGHNRRHLTEVDPVRAPLVIGGVGGSGTRVFWRIACAAGRSMGTRVNEAGDALELTDFADRWLAPYHAARCSAQPVPGADV